MPIQNKLQTAIANLTIWRKGDLRAPHKPLLLLLALSGYRKGHDRFFDYGKEIHTQLLELLNSFGPSRKTHYPNMPFWRLQGDGFWELKNTELYSLQKGSKEPPSRELIQHGVSGGFDEESYQSLRKKPALIDKLAQQILSKYFPESVQDLISTRLGFPLQELRQTRNPAFRRAILRAYNYQCAVCGYNLRYDSTIVGLEAAHIKWKQYGGPCTINNGIALCSLHHSAFDMGVIGLDKNRRLLVSEGVNGNHIIERLFWDFADKLILLPKDALHHPLDDFVDWHREQVFKI